MSVETVVALARPISLVGLAGELVLSLTVFSLTVVSIMGFYGWVHGLSVDSDVAYVPVQNWASS